MREPKAKSSEPYFTGEGELKTLMREKDWALTSLGAPSTWPQSLLTTLSIILNSRFPMFLFWGPELLCFYNDAYRPSLGTDGKHPLMLGSKAEDYWKEIWEEIKPLIDHVLASGEASFSENKPFSIHRNGRLEEVYWTFSYSAVQDESGKPAGVFVTCAETTLQVATMQQLTASEERFRVLVEESIAPKAIFQGTELKLVMANKAALKLWARDKDAIGKPLLKVLSELEGQPLAEKLLEVYHTGNNYAEQEALIYFKHAQKLEAVYVDLLCKPLFDEKLNITSVLFSGIDVTEKVLNQRKLEESADELQFAVNAAELGTWALNVKQGIFTANERLRNWFGFDDVKAVSVDEVLNIIVPEDRERVEAATKQALDFNGDGNYDIIYTIKNKKTGEIMRCHSKGKAMFNKKNFAYLLRGTLQDITEQYNSITDISSSFKNLQMMILQAPVAICLLRGADYTVEIVNSRMVELWGKTQQEMIGKPVFEGLYEIKGQGLEELLDGVYKTGESFFANEMPVELPRNGVMEKRYLNFVYQPLRNSIGEIDGIIATATDVTAQIVARRKIEDNELRLLTLINNAPFAIAICIGFNHTIEMANEAIMNTWGKGKDIIGKTLEEVLPEFREQGVFEWLDQVFATGESYTADNQYMELVVNKERKSFYFKNVFTPLFNADRVVYGVMITTIDLTDLNRAKQAVEESESRFKKVADSAPALIWMSGIDKKCNFVNKAWLAFTGKPLTEQLGDGWIDNVHPEDLAKCAEVFDAAFDERREFYVEYRFLRHDGAYRWISDKGVPRFSSSQVFEGFIGACMDIHDQVLSSEKIKENEERLNIAIEATGLGTWELDLVNNEVKYSDRYLEIMGFEPGGQPAYEDFLKMLHPDDIPKRELEFKKALQTGVLDYVIRLIWKDKSIHWIGAKGKVFYNDNNAPVKMLGTLRDMTDEKKAEQELIERETKFRLLADAMPQIVWTSLPDGRHNYYNTSLSQFTGVVADEILNNNYSKILAPQEQKMYEEKWQQSITAGNDFIFEHQLRRHDGVYRWHLTRAIPQRDDNNSIQMWVGTSTDIHDIKEEEQKKDYFISMASHELKTPLTSIKGYVQILQSLYNNNGDAFLNNSLDILNRQVDTLTGLIADMLDVSKIKSDSLSLKNQPFQLNKLLDDVVVELAYIHNDHNLILNNTAPVQVNGDKDRIGQVLVNFITNAIKYSPGGKEIVISCVVEENKVTVTVTDQGIGIEKKHQEKIFERFYRVEGKNEDTFPGFGIGLFISSEIIKKHGGQIGVISEPHQGAQFYFTLPINPTT